MRNVQLLMSRAKSRLGTGEVDGQVLGVAEDVGVGGEDLEGLSGNDADAGGRGRGMPRPYRAAKRRFAWAGICPALLLG